jgi:superfamily II RNA helicase
MAADAADRPLFDDADLDRIRARPRGLRPEAPVAGGQAPHLSASADPLAPAASWERFLAGTAATGLALYEHQRRALDEIWQGHHVILGTPTGSGKSLVALGLLYKTMAEGRRAVYTSPIKALANEKFFDLCAVFGPDQVGLVTGDARVNAEAPVLCCTAEILAHAALRGRWGPAGERENPGGIGDLPAAVVMDEFHYYADRDRGWAWQVPLLTLPGSQMLLMSATLGDTSSIAADLEARSGRAVATVSSEDRPVPLDFRYAETPFPQTVKDLLAEDKAPIYIVSFTQKGAGVLASSLMSLALVSAAERAELAARLAEQRFDTPYGKEIRRLLSAGVGVHHAGLLPRYRLLVEQLAAVGLLKVICGTDTLGVGVNIPIRTVLFSGLAKFDGEETVILSVRDFKQIAGRAGRKGYDTRGHVVCQASEEELQRRRFGDKAGRGGKAGPRGKGGPRGPARPAGGRPGQVSWDRRTFEQLIARPPEPLRSRFRVTHGMLVQALARDGHPCGYAFLVTLIGRLPEGPGRKQAHLRQLALLSRSLRQAGILFLNTETGRPRLEVDEALQAEFNLHESLSLFLVEAVERLKPKQGDRELTEISLVEAVLEDPRPILFAQEKQRREALAARLKSQGMPFHERQARLRQVSWPRPAEALLEGAFQGFVARHPWLRAEDLRPKSVAREMLEEGLSFNDYVYRYGIQRVEGLLLRHLGAVYRTLIQTIPETARTERLMDMAARLREIIATTDDSLLREWERLIR